MIVVATEFVRETLEPTGVQFRVECDSIASLVAKLERRVARLSVGPTRRVVYIDELGYALTEARAS